MPGCGGCGSGTNKDKLAKDNKDKTEEEKEKDKDKIDFLLFTYKKEILNLIFQKKKYELK